VAEHHPEIVTTPDGRFHATCTCGWTSRDVATVEVAQFHANRHVDGVLGA
jgi:hypothetical protein